VQVPKHHVFGHYHRRWRGQRGGTALRCLKELEACEIHVESRANAVRRSAQFGVTCHSPSPASKTSLFRRYPALRGYSIVRMC